MNKINFSQNGTLNLNHTYISWPIWLRCLMTIGIYAVALLLRFWLLPVEAGFAFITFYPSTVICFYLCGIRPGTLMVLLSAVTGHIIFTPSYWSFAEDKLFVPLVIFLLSASLIGLVVHQLQRYSAELRRSKQALLGILEDQSEVICRFKADGTIIFVNDAYCRLFGKAREQLVGSRWHPKVFPEDLEHVNTQLKTLSPTNLLVTIENRIITKGGAVRWGQFSNHAFFDDQHQLVEVQSVGRDVTERKLSEIALQRESEKNQMLLRNASDGIHIINNCGNILEVSDSFCHMLGYSREELIGMNVTQWDTSLNRGEIFQLIKQQFEKPVRSQFERRHRRKDGSCFDVEISGFPLQLSGKPVVFYSARDISARKSLEQELASKAQELSDLYDNAPCGYHSLAGDGTILRINNTELAWLGYQRDELVGKVKVAELLDAESQSIFASCFPEFKITGHIEDLKLTFITKQGKSVFTLVSATALYDTHGHFLMSRSVIYNRSELKTVEDQLIESEDRFRTMADDAPVLIWMAEANKLCTYFNRGWLDFTGRSLAQELGNGWCEGVHPDDLQHCLSTYLQAFNARQAFVMEYRLRNYQGNYRWVTDSGKPRFDTQGRFLGYIGSCVDITDRHLTEDQNKRFAFTDPLTKLANRRLLSDHLELSIATAKRNGHYGALLYLDLDNFKPLNDLHGHASGDLLLIEAAKRLNQCVRETDTVARLGGDEFVVLLSNLNTELAEAVDEALHIADKIRLMLQEPYQLAHYDNDSERVTHCCTSSIGIAIFGKDQIDAQQVLQKADHAMYQAKRSGRNSIYLFDSLRDGSSQAIV
ncbi:PAS domain S-box protein [Methylococcaceae bacterium WWC4]|nr:PAS domain S-box protein [Methylococcaceae bacterium WWC4]